MRCQGKCQHLKYSSLLADLVGRSKVLSAVSANLMWTFWMQMNCLWGVECLEMQRKELSNKGLRKMDKVACYCPPNSRI